MELIWRKAPKGNGFISRTPQGECHVFRVAKGQRRWTADIDGRPLDAIWCSSDDAMKDIGSSLKD